MKIIKNIKLKSLLIFVIGIFIGVGGMYAASTNYSSDQVLYLDESNQEHILTSVIGDIYSKINFGDATADNILAGKTCLVQGQEVTGTATFSDASTKYAIYLGQGQSFNLNTYTGFENFDSSNFILEPVGFSEKRTSGTVEIENDVWAGIQYTLIKEYNASTGKLTAYGVATGQAGYDNSGYRHVERSITENTDVKAYLLLNASQNTALGGNYQRKNVVYLGQGQTFDLNDYDYATGTYTADSFITEPVSIKKTQSGTVYLSNDLWAGVRYTLVKNYDPTTKTFSTYGEARGNGGYDNSGYRHEVVSQTVRGEMKVYLILN